MKQQYSPLVSIVVPTFNRSALLPRALASALGQTYSELEIIVVNDGSTDDTREQLELYSCETKVTVVHHVRNLGSNAAKNTGLSKARGEFVTILQDDDELLPGAISMLVEQFLRLGRGYGMVFANCVEPESGKWTGLGLDLTREVSLEEAVCGRISGQFLGLWRSEFTRSRPFPEDKSAYENYVWHKIYRVTRVYYVHEPVARYYRTPGSLASFRPDPYSNSRRAENLLLYLSEFGKEIEGFCPTRVYDFYRLLALYRTLEGKRVEALLWALRAWGGKPSVANLTLPLMALTPKVLLVSLLRRRWAK